MVNAIPPRPPLDPVRDLADSLAAVAVPAVLTPADATVAAALVVGIIGGTFGVYQWRRTGPQAEASLTTSAVALIGAMETRLAKLETRISGLEEALAAETAAREANEVYRTRYDSLPNGWTRFDDFIHTGILAYLNQRLEMDHGVAVLLYLDDESETIATGYDIIPAEKARTSPLRLTPAQIAERDRQLKATAKRVRTEHGFD